MPVCYIQPFLQDAFSLLLASVLTLSSAIKLGTRSLNSTDFLKVVPTVLRRSASGKFICNHVGAMTLLVVIC